MSAIRNAVAEATASLIHLAEVSHEAFGSAPESFRHYLWEVGYIAGNAIKGAMIADSLTARLAILKAAARQIADLAAPAEHVVWSSGKLGNSSNFLRNARGVAGHVAAGYSVSEYGGAPGQPVVSVLGRGDRLA